MAWIIPFGANKLKADLYEWINAFNQSGKMIELKDHYYSYVFFFDYYDKKMFYKRIKTRLPKYIKIFKSVAKTYDLPCKSESPKESTLTRYTDPPQPASMDAIIIVINNDFIFIITIVPNC